MITWLLSWLFPLWALLPRARALGSVSFQTVAGVGWMCTIRPPQDGPWQRGAVNSWSGSGVSLGRALRAVLSEVTANPIVPIGGGRTAVKLGGAEFDSDE